MDPLADSNCCCCLGRVYQRLSSGRGLLGVLAAGLATLFFAIICNFYLFFFFVSFCQYVQ